MPRLLDIRKIGKRYTVFDIGTNTPISVAFMTRVQAEEEMDTIFSEEYGTEIGIKPIRAPRSPLEEVKFNAKDMQEAPKRSKKSTDKTRT